MNQRYIIIEGGIGAGKTTLLKELEKHYKYSTVLFEYIETAFGKMMLKKFFAHEITTSTFQYYILNYWLNELEKVRKHNIVFMERGPLAGLAFCNEKDFGKQEYESFLNYMLTIMNNFNIRNLKFMVLNSPVDVNEVIKIINSCSDNLVLFICANVETLIDHIKQRAREGETENYSEEFLNKNANELYNIYQFPNTKIKSLLK